MTDKQALQIPLPFQRFDHFELEHFRAGDNALVLDHLQRLAAGGRADITYLWGERGSGKSHLLQAMCTRLAGTAARTAYIPLQERGALAPNLLEDLEQLDLVCIDDLDTIAGDPEWETAVFNLFNRVKEAGRLLILAATMSPNGLPVALPDLRSRLQSTVIFHLQPLNESDRIAALQQRAALRGMKLGDEVTRYIVRRVPRDMHTLFGLLDRIDRVSLEAKRRITVPFVREVLDSEG